MKNFLFDIQRFDDWATIISAEGINIIDESVDNANATDNADTIQVAAISNTVRAVYGNGGGDVISVEGSPNGIEFSNVTLEGNDGDDLIYINGTVDGIHPSTISIGGGLGNDTVSIYGGNEGIHGGTAGITDKSSVAIDVGDGDNKIFIYGDNDNGIDISNVAITSGAGNDLISIYGGNYGIGGDADYGNTTVSINTGGGVDTISVNSIDNLSEVTIVAGSGDVISVGSGAAKYFFDSADAVTINGATFTANAAGNSADLVSYAEGTSIGSAWNGTVALSGENSLADIDGSIVSAAGNYQIVDGKLTGTVESNDTVAPSTTETITPATVETVAPATAESVTPATTETITPSTVDSITPATVETITPAEVELTGKKYDVVFLIDNTGSMGGYISSVQSAVSSFAQTLRNSGLNCRYALVEYGDINDSSIKTYEFTADTDTFISNVNNISMTNGGDIPESGLESLVDGALTMNFDEDADKRFIVITDADFHNFGENGDGDIENYLVTKDVSQKLIENEVTMDVVGRAGNCQTEWEPLANNTGGKFYLLGEDFPSIFGDIAASMVNIIDLGTVPDEQTGYFVSTITSAEKNTFTTPLFRTNIGAENEITAGSVNEVKVYAAESDTSYAQTIIITEGWNVTATENDDVLKINGSNVTVTGGNGSDVFDLSSDVKTVALMDINSAEDKLSFGNYIQPGTMTQTIEDGHLVLTTDDLRVDLPAMAEMTDEFLDYSVSNAGTPTTIRELIYGVQSGVNDSFISFAHWSFAFDSSAERAAFI